MRLSGRGVYCTSHARSKTLPTGPSLEEKVWSYLKKLANVLTFVDFSVQVTLKRTGLALTCFFKEALYVIIQLGYNAKSLPSQSR